MNRRRVLIIALLALGCRPTPPPVAPSRPAAVVIVYESADQAVPPQTHDARQELEVRGHVVYVVDDDVVTGDGNTPAYLVAAIAKAREIGLPALVLVADNGALRAVTLPPTAAQIVAEASK